VVFPLTHLLLNPQVWKQSCNHVDLNKKGGGGGGSVIMRRGALIGELGYWNGAPEADANGKKKNKSRER
jgi:hypothetical protein